MRVSEGVCGGAPCLKIEWEPPANVSSQSLAVFSRSVAGATSGLDTSTPPKMIWRGEIAAETLNKAKEKLMALITKLREQPELSGLTIQTTVGGLAKIVES